MDDEALIDELERVMTQAIQHPAPQCSLELNRGETGALNVLAALPQGITAGQLGARLGVGSGRTADLLGSLERKKLVRRTAHETDNRKVIASITPAGQALVAEKRQQFRQEQRALLEALGEKDAQDFVRLMARIASLMAEQDKR